MRMLSMNLNNNLEEEIRLMEIVENTIDSKLNVMEEIRHRNKEENREENLEYDVREGESDSRSVISNLSEGTEMLGMPEEDDLLIEDADGKVRSLQEWVDEYRKFANEEIEEVNNRTKETVDKVADALFELRRWLKELEECSMNERGMGAMEEYLKDEKAKQCLLWIGDTGASAHMTRTWEGYVKYKKAHTKAQFGRNGDMSKIDLMGKWKGKSY